MPSQFGHRVGWLPISESLDDEEVDGLVGHVSLWRVVASAVA
jgi:hypothetical protein